MLHAVVCYYLNYFKNYLLLLNMTFFKNYYLLIAFQNRFQYLKIYVPQLIMSITGSLKLFLELTRVAMKFVRSIATNSIFCITKGNFERKILRH